MLRQGRTADQQLAAVISGFPKVPPLFRRLFPYSKCAAAVMTCFVIVSDLSSGWKHSGMLSYPNLEAPPCIRC